MRLNGEVKVTAAFWSMGGYFTFIVKATIMTTAKIKNLMYPFIITTPFRSVAQPPTFLPLRVLTLSVLPDKNIILQKAKLSTPTWVLTNRKNRI